MASRAVPPRTLAFLSFQLDQPKEFTVSWKVDSGRLHLDTLYSNGPVLDLPPGFVADAKKLAADSWQIGTFVREGNAMAIILTLTTQ